LTNALSASPKLKKSIQLKIRGPLSTTYMCQAKDQRRGNKILEKQKILGISLSRISRILRRIKLINRSPNPKIRGRKVQHYLINRKRAHP
jgi:hypothetical protein